MTATRARSRTRSVTRPAASPWKHPRPAAGPAPPASLPPLPKNRPLSLEQVFTPHPCGRLISVDRTAVGLRLRITDGDKPLRHDDEDIMVAAAKSHPTKQMLQISDGGIGLLVKLIDDDDGPCYLLRWTEHDRPAPASWLLSTRDASFFRWAMLLAGARFRARGGATFGLLPEIAVEVA